MCVCRILINIVWRFVSWVEISCLVVVLLTAVEEIMPDDVWKTAETCRLIICFYVACDCAVTKCILINGERAVA